MQSNSLKIDVDLSHLQRVLPDQDTSRPSSAASGGSPVAELEGSGSGRHLLLKSTLAGADRRSKNGVEEDQASRKEDNLEGALKRSRKGEPVARRRSASTQSTSVSSFSSAVSIKNLDKKKLRHLEPCLDNDAGGIATVADPHYLPAGTDAGLLKQFLLSDVEDTQAPYSRREGSVDCRSPSATYAPPQHCASGGGGDSLQTWHYPIVLPRPLSKTDSSCAGASDTYPADDARSVSSASSNPTSLGTGSADVDESKGASPVSLYSSGTGQLLAALLSPAEPYNAFPDQGPSCALSSDLAQLSSVHSGSVTIPSSAGQLESCPSSALSAPQMQELITALTSSTPVLSGKSGMPSFQEEDFGPTQVPVFSAQASSCNLTASSAASCGSAPSSAGLQVRTDTTARGHQREGSAESNASLEAESLSQGTEMPSWGADFEEQEAVAISGVSGRNLPSTPSLHDQVHAVPYALSVQPGRSDSGYLKSTQLDGQASIGSLKESKTSTESTLVGLEDNSPSTVSPSLGRGIDQSQRPTSQPPRTLQPEVDCRVSEDPAAGTQGQDEGPVPLPQEEGDGGGSLTPVGRQMGTDSGEDLGQHTSSQATTFTESHSVTDTGSSVAMDGCTGGDSAFRADSELLHLEMVREGEDGRIAYGQSAAGASGGQLTTSDILERNKPCSKYSLAVSGGTYTAATYRDAAAYVHTYVLLSCS